MAAYITSLCSDVFRAMAPQPGAIELELDLAPARLAVDQAIPCGLLVNELVSNAIKHAFPQGRSGRVRVDLQPLAEGPGWCLRVADNGAGLPAGFALDQFTTLGLRLASELARQLGGRLAILSGPGAVFEVVFGQSSP